MEIHVQHSAAMRKALSDERRISCGLFCVGIVVGLLGSIITHGLAFLPSVIFVYWAWIGWKNAVAIYGIGDGELRLESPVEQTIPLSAVSCIINMAPYANLWCPVYIKLKTGGFLNTYLYCYIPVGQGILEHLKARGVKVWNLWFWQEK